MGKQVTYEQARTLLLERLSPLGTERVTLARCEGRVLAEDIAATESIPSFDRSSYDGYAFRSADVAGATPDAPVTLAVLEEIPAGGVPTLSVSKGTAARTRANPQLQLLCANSCPDKGGLGASLPGHGRG